MDQGKLNDILESHGEWLMGEKREKANLREADLYGADLRGVDLRMADLRGANLCMSNLQGANLFGANLCMSNLQGANLFGANLCMSNLQGANLFEANLCISNLQRAQLFGANLSGANMEIADLQEAKLLGADLRGADLYGALLSEKIIQVGPIGSRRDYTIYWVDRDIVKCGCWNDCKGGSLEEFKKRVDKIYPAENKDTLQFRNEYLAAIAMFERLRDDAGKSV